MLFNQRKESCLANVQNLLKVVSGNFFPQVFLNQLLDLFICKTLVYLNHDIIPLFRKSISLFRCSLLNLKSTKNGSLLILI